MKCFFLISLLIGIALQVTIKDSDTCNACTELKSKNDCVNPQYNLECEWVNSSCSKKAIFIYKEYCEQITDPATKCSKTPGCAYIESKCTHFTGCTAYVKTTQSDCQAISYKCTTNGVTCDDISDCSNYSKEMCEISLSINSPFKCKLENDTCRNYKCIEADVSLITNYQCSKWMSGCVTTGMGCIDARPPCAQYTGTVVTCSKMIGQDGKCRFDYGTQCRASKCSEIKLINWNDAYCNDYKPGCKSNGFSCVAMLLSCTTYDGDVTTCLSYKGSDGQCVYDSTTNKCKAKKCEDVISGILSECTTYLSGCLTNGVTCITILQNCNKYTGIKNICQNITGLDGKCKGTSDTDSTAFCALKTCADDDLGTETSDAECQTIQNGCITTGMGCVRVLQSCVNYIDDGNENCLKLIGSEGKCKIGTGGKCAAKTCADNTTATTNEECNDFKTGCVTTGTGCVAQKLCADTLEQTACEGTDSCSWSSQCVSLTDCTQLATKSLCLNYKSTNGPCFWWDNGWSSGCKLSQCSDFISKDDDQCNAYKPGCVTNGTTCADPANCHPEFKGTKETCQKFKALCTNTAVATADSTCKTKSCTDTITTTSDSECQAYHPDCLYAGINKCIDKIAGCTNYRGTKEDCSKFTGYVNSTTRVKCYKLYNDYCIDRKCSYATGMTSNVDCAVFMDGCIFNGGDSCASVNDTCYEYKYKTQSSECQQFKGNNGTLQCYDGTSNSCKYKECSDARSTDIDTDLECQQFMSTCVYDGNYGRRCIPNTIECNLFLGTTNQCNKLVRNGKQCSQKLVCKDRECSDKINATSNDDCVNYHKNCRLVYGTQKCKTSESQCAGYVLTSTTNAQIYCNSVNTFSNDLCAYSPTFPKFCVNRQCQYWTTTLASTISCTNYLGPNTCTLTTLNNCYQIGSCQSYQIPKTETNKEAWCNNFYTFGGSKKCTYTQGEFCDSIQILRIVMIILDQIVYFMEINVIKLNLHVLIIHQLLFLIRTRKLFYVHFQNHMIIKQLNNANIYKQFQKLIVVKYHVNKFNLLLLKKAVILELHVYFIVVHVTQQKTAIYDKRMFCQNMQTTIGLYCSFNSTTNRCDDPKLCTEQSGTADICQNLRNKNGEIYYLYCTNHCAISEDDAICSNVKGIFSNVNDCNIRTTPGACILINGVCTSKGIDCTALNGSDLSTCQSFKLSDGNYCTWISGQKCTLGQASCSDWKGDKYNSLEVCSKLKNRSGQSCTWIRDKECAEISCDSVISPFSVLDCQLFKEQCYFYKGYCIEDQNNCNLFIAHGITSAEKLTYCKGRYNQFYQQCTYIFGNYCINLDACNTYNVSGQSDKLNICKNAITKDSNGCTYFTGDTCIAFPNDCSEYSGKWCIGKAGDNKCKQVEDCQDIPNPMNFADCQKYSSQCTYYKNKCIEAQSCEQYPQPHNNAIAYCKEYRDREGVLCTATYDDDQNCQTRTCIDNETLYFTTHEECQEYSPQCVTKGLGCGWQQLCYRQFNSTFFCKIKECDDNITAQTQADCDSYFPNGNCKWRNPGCTKSTTSCAGYRGTLLECQKIIVNNIVCWSDQQARGACRDLKCEDKATAINDSDCSTFLTGCVFNGVGCITKGSPCNQFKGTTVTCLNFDANSASPCWGLSTSIAACVDKQCSYLAGKTNLECQTFLPNSNCITNGTGCIIQSPKKCSLFKGNDETCPTFISTEGICKKGLHGYCTKRQCYEAPNNLTTDSQCQEWSPGCYTNGKGCTSLQQCSNNQTQTSCTANTSCQWVNSCRVKAVACSSLYGQSLCGNNVDKECIWQKNKCRDPNCSDLDSSFNTHKQCNDAMNGCTTTGSGCIEYGICSSYTTKIICEAANTTESTKKCTWANSQCRIKQCSDFTETSDKACNALLTGCKTNGITCIGSTYDCSVFSENQSLCLQDSQGHPCLYVNGTCYNFYQCTDVQQPSQSFCNSFSSNCVEGVNTCISINQCNKYIDQVSCYKGVNGTTCGWLPPAQQLTLQQKCAEFKQCSDAAGTTLDDCIAWNSNCVSDGINCVTINDCTSYNKEMSCIKDKSNNVCFWTGTTCKIKQCSDLTATTDAECSSNIVKEGTCTTDGIKCVSRSTCKSYTTEASCTIGSDGIPCVFNYLLGQTTGNKTCVPQECTDILSTTNEQCIGEINNKPCVSNGKNCVSQGTCSSYKNKLSCAAGGSDNSICVFSSVPITADPLAGTCKLFNSCADASGDSNICLLNRSCRYIEATNKCEAMDCATFNTNGQCNPYLSFDGKFQTLCFLVKNVCVEVDPTTLSQEDCFSQISKYSFTWNSETSKCQSCKTITPSNNTTNSTVDNNITTQQGYFLQFSVGLVLLVNIVWI